MNIQAIVLSVSSHFHQSHQPAVSARNRQKKRTCARPQIRHYPLKTNNLFYSSYNLHQNLRSNLHDLIRYEKLRMYLKYRIGSEFILNKFLAFRIGLNHGDLTSGFGVNYKNYKIDYSFLMDNDGFADVHRFSFSAGF